MLCMCDSCKHIRALREWLFMQHGDWAGVRRAFNPNDASYFKGAWGYVNLRSSVIAAEIPIA